jgi:glucose/arabinose dehydrogenase
MHVSADGSSLGAAPVSALAVGVRLRSAVQGPDGILYVVTDGDGGSGAIWRIVPV